MASNDDLVRSSALTRFRLAPNPGPMSLDGTNSYIISARGAQAVSSRFDTARDSAAQVVTGQSVTSQGAPARPQPTVVVDPGPLDAHHLEQLAGAGPVELVLITHRHADHTEASEQFHRLTGAPVRALDPAYCHGGDPLTDSEVIEAAGVEIRVLATPGHTSDSVSFHLPADRPAESDGPTEADRQPGPNGAAGSVLTGDTILGRGTTILDYPDGRLGPYLESLQKLARLGPATVLPAHGPVLPDLAEICVAYTEHRQQRLDQIRLALGTLGANAAADAVADLVYNDVNPSVRGAALKSVQAQLDYLRG